ncbi:MAG TPA: LysR substrate-binding domain-containing protein [Polyangiaceae bacterium]|nr:LysR substrate-binding domain-containing protein [Polyangiaceae bacterium]
MSASPSRHAPLPFTLRQLQYAATIADCLSFSKAAELCHVSQPSLSAQIAELEQALGLRLFERDRRHVLVTPAGHALLERARVLLRDATDLRELAIRSSDPLSGTLKIGVIPTVAPYLLPQLAPALNRALRKLTLLWIEDKTSKLVSDLDSGAIDGALLALEADIGDMAHEIIGRDPFVLATAPGHPLAKGQTALKPAELCDVSVLLLDDGHCFRDQALSFCASARAQELEFRATSLQTLAQMVAAGTGVTLLPALAVPMEAAHAKLHIRPFSKPSPGRTLALIWRKGSPVAPALKEVAQIAREIYPTLHAAQGQTGPSPTRNIRRATLSSASPRHTSNR